MNDFAALRGDWMKRSLGGLVSRIEEVDEGGIWEGSRGREKVRGLVDLYEVMIVVLEVSLTMRYPPRQSRLIKGGNSSHHDPVPFWPRAESPCGHDGTSTEPGPHDPPAYPEHDQALPLLSHLCRPRPVPIAHADAGEMGHRA